MHACILSSQKSEETGPLQLAETSQILEQITEPLSPSQIHSIAIAGHPRGCRRDNFSSSEPLSLLSMALLRCCGRCSAEAAYKRSTPAGHVNFQDEVSAAFRASDGVLLLVDAVDGTMLVTEKVVKQALSEGLSVALLITKVDRLITELKLPPSDAYHKLHHTIQEVNALIASHSGSDKGLEVSRCTPPNPPVSASPSRSRT